MPKHQQARGWPWFTGLLIMIGLCTAALASPPVPCVAPDNGLGTADMPAPCPYVAPFEPMQISNGLPAGTTIDVDPILDGFLGILRTPGGSLGGEMTQFQAHMQLALTGTGGLAGFIRNLNMSPMNVQIDHAPRTLGSSLQGFDSELMQLQGQITGDPDFDLLRITAGTNFGMPSPGRTALSQGAGASWTVSSFFDITYRIDFVGRPGGPLGGMSGSTTGTIRMHQGYVLWATGDLHKMHYPQMPNVDGWDVRATQSVQMADDWRCSETGWITDVHFWGSWRFGLHRKIEKFRLAIYSDVPALPGGPYSHPGTLLWQKDISRYAEVPMPVTAMEGWYDPESGLFNWPDHSQLIQYDIILDSVDWFHQDINTIYWLAISAVVPDTALGLGYSWGWKSSIDHFNDDGTWRIPGVTGGCSAPDNGSGTISMPPHCPQIGNAPMQILNGLPPGATVDCASTIDAYGPSSEGPGGSLGGDIHQYQASIFMDMTGTGPLSGYLRSLSIPIQVQASTGPRLPGTSPQSFPTDLMQIQGQITGDPDFDLLRITGGTNFGMPSPGHTTLTISGGGTWAVESFFDITYRIDFVGHPGSPFGGMSGSTTGTIRMAVPTGTGMSWQELHEPPTFAQSMDLSFVLTGKLAGCCTGMRGNLDSDPSDQVDIADLQVAIDYLFFGGPLGPCPQENDLNGDNSIDIADLQVLIDYLFFGSMLPIC